MRAFIAIPLSQITKEYLGRIQNNLKTSQADVKWVKPDNLHITLKFLGEITQQQIDSINEHIRNIAGRNNKFLIQLTTLGAFPKIENPRVIWIGIDKKSDELIKKLALELELNLEKIGFPKENQEFNSHITLGRTKSSFNRNNLIQALLEINNKLPRKEGIEFTAEEIILFKSILSASGPAYEKVSATNLKTT